MDFGFAILLASVSALSWWLSGYDSQVTGENRSADLRRRAFRCGATLLLLALGVGAAAGLGRFGGFVFIAIIVPLAILWTGCVSEMLARAFHRLIDSPDSREFDSNELTRDLDRLAQLVQQGRNHEAIGLCARLRESATASGVGLETTLFRVYDDMFEGGCFSSPALLDAQKAYEQGHCLLAESRLNEILKKEPGNLTAALMLMKLYSLNLRNGARATAVLHALEERRAVPPGFGDYSRRRIETWFDPNPHRTKNSQSIEFLLTRKNYEEPPLEAAETVGGSVADLLKSGHLGTAIERLERDLKYRPDDFDLRLQLAEAHGLYCCNLSRAAEIVTKMEGDRAFSAEQVQVAKRKLQEWRERRSAAV